MADHDSNGTPDFSKGVAFASVPDGGMLAGTAGPDAVLLVRHGDRLNAFGASCTHLGAPLAEGSILGDTIRCPWHHACFDRHSGQAVRAPAFHPLPRWTVERVGDVVRVTGGEDSGRPALAPSEGPGPVIIGGGAAGYAAAHELRRLEYWGPITLVSSEAHPPYDRTLLTKDYLDGSFGDDRLPIAGPSLRQLGVTVLGDTTVDRIDTAGKHVTLNGGRVLDYTKLLLATGAVARCLDLSGGDLPHVRTLRSLDDCRAILERLTPGIRVAVVGSSFIGLEAAASIRSRGFSVTVVTPDTEPLGRLLGPQLSRAIFAAHTAKGVVFRLGADVARITPQALHCVDGSEIPADLVVVGIGVTPRTELAVQAGLTVNDGVVVDDTLRTSDADIFAAGDIARWPDPHSGTAIRVEHWVVAQRQGQIAARNMLGASDVYDAVPFFWSKHFDLSVRYVGHADDWDDLLIEGDLDARSAIIRYRKDGRDAAVATVEQDRAALEIEKHMEDEIAPRAA